MNASLESTPTPAPEATDTVQVRHFDPAQQAALEALAAVLFPTATIAQATHAQPEPDCPLCLGARFVGGDDPDGGPVTEACPVCNVGGAVVTALTTRAVA